MTVGIHLQSAQSPTPSLRDSCSGAAASHRRPWDRPGGSSFVTSQSEGFKLRMCVCVCVGWVGVDVKQTSKISCELWSITENRFLGRCTTATGNCESAAALNPSEVHIWFVSHRWTYSALHFCCYLQQMPAGVGLFFTDSKAREAAFEGDDELGEASGWDG